VTAGWLRGVGARLGSVAAEFYEGVKDFVGKMVCSSFKRDLAVYLA
jgi:hypothetical protein